MQQRNRRFGELLKAGTAAMGHIINKSQVGIEAELGDSLGVAGVTIERYKSGYIPPEHAVTLMAETCVDRGLMGQRWLEQFLAAADFTPFNRQTLTQKLFPAHPVQHQPVPRSNAPYPSGQALVRRHTLLHDILDALGGTHAITVLLGMGGIGKSTIAADAAVQFCNEGHHGRLVAWVSDKDRAGACHLSHLLETLTQVLDYPGLLALPTYERSQTVLALLRQMPVLLVVDNADTITDTALFEWIRQVSLPSRVLLTSRISIPALPDALEIEIGPLSDAEQQQLVSTYVLRPHVRRQGITVADVLPLLNPAGGNPKALLLMLGMVHHCSAQDVLRELTIHDQLFDDLFVQNWQRLRPDAQQVLMVLTFFDQSVPGAALAFCADLSQPAFVRIAEQLSDHALLETERASFSAPVHYSLHPLVRAFVETRLCDLPPAREQQLRTRWLTWCVDAVQAVGFCWDDLERLGTLDPFYPTIQAAIAWADAHARHHTVLLLTEHVRYYTNVRGLWGATELRQYERQARAARSLGLLEDEIVALARHVQILSKQGRLGEAEPLRGHLLTAGESFYARHLSATCNTPPRRYTRADEAAFEYGHALALYARAQQHIPLAETHWRRLLQLSAVIGGQHYVVNRRWMGIVLLEQGRTSEAIEWFTCSLADARAINDVRSIIGNTLKLAALAVERGDYDAATPLLDDVQRIATQHHDRRRLAECHRLSAQVALARDNRAQAAQALHDALDLFKRLGMQPEISMTQSTLHKLGH